MWKGWGVLIWPQLARVYRLPISKTLHFVGNAHFKNLAFCDFVLARSKLDVAHNVFPIEVKSGKNASHRSLDKFVEKFRSYVAKPYLLWMKDRKTQDGVEYLPIYMAPCLAEEGL